jgi:ABC-type sugar transport system substrate-binding protein
VIVSNTRVKCDLLNAHIGSNDVVGGQLEAAAVLSKIGGKGNVVVIQGPIGQSAQIERLQGNEKASGGEGPVGFRGYEIGVGKTEAPRFPGDSLNPGMMVAVSACPTILAKRFDICLENYLLLCFVEVVCPLQRFAISTITPKSQPISKRRKNA